MPFPAKCWPRLDDYCFQWRVGLWGSCCGFLPDPSHFRRTRRSAEATKLLNKGTKICLSAPPGIGHMNFRFQLVMARGIVSATVHRAQRQWPSHERRPPTQSQQLSRGKFCISPTLMYLAAVMDFSAPSPSGFGCRTTITTFTTTSHPCCRSALLSASSTVTVARHAGRRRLPPPP